MRGGERVVFAGEGLAFGVPLEEGEVGDPEKFKAGGVDKITLSS